MSDSPTVVQIDAARIPLRQASPIDTFLQTALSQQARPNMRRMSVDTKSYELAEHFLQDVRSATKEETQELAEAIQMTVEDFCADIEARRQDNSQFGVGA